MSRTFSVLTIAAALTISPTFVWGQPTNEAPRSQVVAGNSHFAAELYARLASTDGNLFFSPYSISTALAMTYAGARNETAQEMAKVLHFGKSERSVHFGFGELHRLLNDGKTKRSYELKTANALWGQKDYGFLPDFLGKIEAVYGAGLKEVDFIAGTEAARKSSNAWVEAQTNQKIRELLKPGALTPDARLVLTNAIYLKAPWQDEFFAEATKPGEFTLADGAKAETPLMFKVEKASYFDGDDFQLAELPYEHHELSMIVLLPRKHDGIAGLEKRLTPENLAKWLKSARPHQTHIRLPKFKTTSEFSLKKVLSAMGMSGAFDPREADFSGMTSREKIYISDVIHKAYVDVHEKGTEAAAATAVLAFAGGLPPPLAKAEFHVNRPFVFLIKERATGSILFMGRIMDPRK